MVSLIALIPFFAEASGPSAGTVLQTRTARLTNESLVNLDIEWAILHSNNNTYFIMGGGDYTSLYKVGSSYAVDIDGTVTQMGTPQGVAYVTSGGRNYTFARFPVSKFGLTGTSYLTTGNTLKTLVGE